jgi:hypothetical protein
MNRNIDFIYDAAMQLEKNISIPVTIKSTGLENDAFLVIKNFNFIVEAKSEIRAANKGVILSQIKELQSKATKSLILIAKFIASDIALELKEKAINYLDISGNAFISINDFIIYITGKKLKKIEKTNPSRAFQEAGIKLIFNFLTNPEDLQLPYRELAQQTGIAIGSVSNIINELEDLNFILKSGKKRILKNKKELLNRWIVSYHDILRPRLFKRKMRFHGNSDYTNWKRIELFTDKEYSTLWGGEPGGAILTNFLKPSLFTIYTLLSWQECAKIAGLIPDESGDIEILQIFWSKLGPREKDMAIVPRVLIYADLISSGLSRNIETAEIIFDNELQDFK